MGAAVFPVYAGMNRHSGTASSGDSGVPRVRGDEPQAVREAIAEAKVFPVYAGMNRPIATGRALSTGVPRVRGDEPTSCRRPSPLSVCSPCTRG